MATRPGLFLGKKLLSSLVSDNPFNTKHTIIPLFRHSRKSLSLSNPKTLDISRTHTHPE